MKIRILNKLQVDQVLKAVIPCAKKKDDLYPFTESKPTGLIPVMGKPLVKHIIYNLQELGVDDIYLITNHLEDEFADIFEEYTNVNLIHQEHPTGTADALELCSFIDDDFFVVNGDVIVSEEDLKALKQKHKDSESDATILATEQNKPEKFGVLSITNDRVKSLEEKPEEAENPLVNTGIYIFKPSVFNAIENAGTSDLTDAVKQLVDENDVRFEIAQKYWIDINSPKKLWKADQIKRTNEITEKSISDEAEIHEDASITGNVRVEPKAEIKAGTVIEGDTYIGEEAVIGPNTTVKDSTVGKKSQVRHCAIEEVLTFEKTIVDPNVFIEQSILGEETDVLSNTAIRESFIGPRSYIEINNSIRGVKFVPDARTDLSEISK